MLLQAAAIALLPEVDEDEHQHVSTHIHSGLLM
jgi:hypothetical protein